MDKKEFAAAALDSEHEIYVVHIGLVSSVALSKSSPFKLNIHSFHKPCISSLIAEEALIKVPDKYVNFTGIFSLDLAFKLPKYTRINDHAIKLVNSR